jgi:hypothetical protein
MHPKAVDTFLEELIVRGGLAENFCHYQPNYDNLNGAWSWARESLMIHATDKREVLYTQEELENAKTHDTLWNAAQLEMVYYGKMHGYMRMYWAKKILEWTTGPEEALATAIYLNDKYELDGRDPNGYVGCMWSICGIHDQGWKERPVFGKISSVRSNKRAREKALTKWGKKLKWEKGEDSGAQEGKGEAGLGNKRELHLILLADKQTNTHYCLHTHTPPHSFTLSFALLQQKNYPLPHPTFIQVLYIQTHSSPHTLYPNPSSSLSLSLSPLVQALD